MGHANIQPIRSTGFKCSSCTVERATITKEEYYEWLTSEMPKCPMEEKGCPGVSGEYHSATKCLYIRDEVVKHFNNSSADLFDGYSYEDYEYAVQTYLFFKYGLSNTQLVAFVTEKVTFCKFCVGNKASLTTTY